MTASMLRIGAAIGGCGIAVAVLAAAPYPERGSSMVSSDHPLASHAGAELLAGGGNAADAAVATALAAGVVQPAGSGLGGGGFAVGYDGKKTWSLDFREVAPANATVTMFRDAEGIVVPGASRNGGAAVAVPCESRGLAQIVRDHGRLGVRQAAAPALRLARDGFPMGPHLARALQRTDDAQVTRLFSVGGQLLGLGDRVRRPRLAKTLSEWVRTGGEGLATGQGARALVDATSGGDGVLTLDDLREHEPRAREAIRVRYRGYTLLTMPPPSSGGVVLGQVLSVLEGYDVRALGHNSSEYVHLIAEVFAHSYADRAHYLGDPDFTEVPVERLLSPARIAEIRQAVWPARTFGPEHYGPLIAPVEDAGTQHISVVDETGYAVALTTTINTSFGSGLVASNGVILNNQMDDFVAAPGIPNEYGLVGREANAVQPGKRPLSSMTPTVVLDPEGRVVMSIGASGGSTIISAVVQVFLNLVEFDMDAQEAVAAARFHHQWIPDVLWLEPDFPRDVQRALEARGHSLQVRDGFSAVQVVRVTGNQLEGGADPRKGGWPAAVR